MNHNPYRDWMFEDLQTLSPSQTVELHRHLQTCPDCRSLSGALYEMEHKLRFAGMVSPQAGFTTRWQERRQNDRLKVHRRQTRLVSLLILSGLITVLSALAILFWPWLSASEAVFWAAVYQLYSVYNLMASVGGFFTALLRAMVEVVPPVGWLLAIGMVFELGVLWVVSLRLLTNSRRLVIQ